MAHYVAARDRAGGEPHNIEAELPTFSERISADLRYPLSFVDGQFDDFAAWKSRARQRIVERMLKPPPAAPFDAKVLAKQDNGTYVTRRIAFNISGLNRIVGLLLVPKTAGPKPGMVILHDHGAEFRWGKEKVARTDKATDPHLRAFVDRHYGGRYIADVLARRGYVCLTYDAFFWGDRSRKEGAKDAYHTQQSVGMNLMQLGMTFAGLIAHEDIRAAEFLAAHPSVDANRIGCVGLSMGCYRSWHLAALSDRIKACIGVGWMCTNAVLMTPGNNQTRGHSAMSMLIPGIRLDLDYPDEASVACPTPMLLYNGTKDGLFPVRGVEPAFDKIRNVYASQGVNDRLETRLWPVPHEFNREMQEAAFDWLDRWLEK
jgi:dienelactone hydrolase